MEKKRMETMVQLARMYGTAEALEPLTNLPLEDTFPMIDSWTKEYYWRAEKNLVDFFEEKIKTLKQSNPLS